jgi:hypothetical protein
MDIDETKTKLQKYLGTGVQALLVRDGKILVKHSGISSDLMYRIRQDAGEHEVKFEGLSQPRF